MLEESIWILSSVLIYYNKRAAVLETKNTLKEQEVKQNGLDAVKQKIKALKAQSSNLIRKYCGGFDVNPLYSNVVRLLLDYTLHKHKCWSR